MSTLYTTSRLGSTGVAWRAGRHGAGPTWAAGRAGARLGWAVAWAYLAGCSVTVDPGDGEQLCAPEGSSRRCPESLTCYLWSDGEERCARVPPDGGTGGVAGDAGDTGGGGDAGDAGDAGGGGDAGDVGSGGDAGGDGGDVGALVFEENFDSFSVKTSPFTGMALEAVAAPWYYMPPLGSPDSEVVRYSVALWDAEAFSVEDGILSIRAWEDADGRWHSGAMASMDPTGAGFGRQYGLFEVRCRMPRSGEGAWPAFRLYSQQAIINYVEDTQLPTMEIAGFEWWGADFEMQRAFVEQASYNRLPEDGPAEDSLFQRYTTVPGGALPWADFHVYGVRVDPVHTTWYIDGAETGQINTPHSYHQSPLFVMLAYAVGGHGWTTEGMVAGASLDVDWIRVYAVPEDTCGPASGRIMPPGTCLSPGQSVVSEAGRFVFMCEHDGYLRLYDGPVVIWTSDVGVENPSACVMRADGDLVIEGRAGEVVVNGDKGRANSTLTVQSDGNVVIRNQAGEPLWDTGTWR